MLSTFFQRNASHYSLLTITGLKNPSQNHKSCQRGYSLTSHLSLLTSKNRAQRSHELWRVFRKIQKLRRIFHLGRRIRETFAFLRRQNEIRLQIPDNQKKRPIFMRIIGEIQHPTLKITIFKMGERTSVKFENERYEQTYKLGTDERWARLETIQQWVDTDFLEKVLQTFQQMHQAQMSAISRLFTTESENIFEEII
jgi:hypothetical protein